MQFGNKDEMHSGIRINANLAQFSLLTGLASLKIILAFALFLVGFSLLLVRIILKSLIVIILNDFVFGNQEHVSFLVPLADIFLVN